MVGGGGYILAGGRWCWLVVDGGGWWHSLVFLISEFGKCGPSINEDIKNHQSHVITW